MNTLINRTISIRDLGLIDYQKAWDYQTRLFNEILEIKKAVRLTPDTPQATPNYLLICEHPHVYTLGKSGDEKNLLVGNRELKDLNASFVLTNRGGDITYHGPGQMVVYPVIDLENFFTDIHRYMRLLEEAVIQVLQSYHIKAGRIPGLTGVWMDADEPAKARKICALGVKTSRWVAMHGLAFNFDPDLSYFSHIVPCGISDKAVTSMQKESPYPIDRQEVKELLLNKIVQLFDMNPARS